MLRREKPILMSGAMVRAILDGRKLQTRRAVKGPISFIGGRGEEADPSKWGWAFDGPDQHGWAVLARGLNERFDNGCVSIPCPYGQPGDREWTTFRQASPPREGWYWVRLEADAPERMMYLRHVPDEPQDSPSEHDVERWVWGKDEHDDPEALSLDVREPLDIAWRRPGDRLWVKETWRTAKCFDADSPTKIGREALGAGWDKPWAPVEYVADGARDNWPDSFGDAGKTRVSIHMPRWASRLTLEVTGVRVERIQDISEEDARAEGVERHPEPFTSGWRNYEPSPTFESVAYHPTARESFASLWRSINGAESWEQNPWIWVVSFTVVPR